jgi:hypothetical protein
VKQFDKIQTAFFFDGFSGGATFTRWRRVDCCAPMESVAQPHRCIIATYLGKVLVNGDNFESDDEVGLRPQNLCQLLGCLRQFSGGYVLIFLLVLQRLLTANIINRSTCSCITLCGKRIIVADSKNGYIAAVICPPNTSLPSAKLVSDNNAYDYGQYS